MNTKSLQVVVHHSTKRETDKLCNRQRCLEKWESGDGGGDGGGDTCSLSLQDQLHGEHGRGGSYDCHQDQRR